MAVSIKMARLALTAAAAALCFLPAALAAFSPYPAYPPAYNANPRTNLTANLTAASAPSGRVALDQTMMLGTQTNQDRLLLRETAYHDSKWLRVSDADVIYPKEGQAGSTIYAIKVIDQKKDGKNGEVKVKKGGVGSNFVHLRFHSQRGKSLHYLVEIYGH